MPLLLDAAGMFYTVWHFERYSNPFIIDMIRQAKDAPKRAPPIVSVGKCTPNHIRVNGIVIIQIMIIVNSIRFIIIFFT